MDNNYPITKAFLSCSLRNTDAPFIRFVEDILSTHNIQAFGTVGRYDAVPENPAESMRKNVALADIIVIAATSRYFQKDIQTGYSSSGLSEMIHVESGIAYASNKPIVVFVQEGTNVGNFLPNVTQYIILNGTQKDLEEKWNLICCLLQNAICISSEHKQQKSTNEFWNLVKGGLAIFGGVKVVEYLTEDTNEYTPRRTYAKRKTVVKKAKPKVGQSKKRY